MRRSVSALVFTISVSSAVFAGETVRNGSGTISAALPAGWSEDTYRKKTKSRENLYLVSESIGAITIYADCPADDAFDFVEKYEGLYGEAHDMRRVEVAGEGATRLEWRPLGRVFVDVLVPFAGAPGGHCWIRFETRGDPTAERIRRGKEALQEVLSTLRLRSSARKSTTGRRRGRQGGAQRPRLFNDEKSISVVVPAAWGEEISTRGENTRSPRKVFLISNDGKARLSVDWTSLYKSVPEYLEERKGYRQVPQSVESLQILGRKATRITWQRSVHRSVEVFVPFRVAGTGFYCFRLSSKEKDETAFSRYEPALESVLESFQATRDQLGGRR